MRHKELLARESELGVPESAIMFAAWLVSKRVLHLEGKSFGVRFLRADVSKDGSVTFVFARWELLLWKEECEDGSIATRYDGDQLPPKMKLGEAIGALQKKAAEARIKRLAQGAS